MSIMTVFHGPGMTREHYDAITGIVNWKQNPVDGMVLHIAGFDENGDLRVVDVWDSPQQLESFFATRLGPAFQQLGLSQPPPPAVYPVHNLDVYHGGG